MATRFMKDEEGGEVLDTATGLIWQRCCLGQTWNGTTCVGEAKEMDWYAAINYANKLEGWRLPTMDELNMLVNPVYCPTISPTVFPNTPSGACWSSSLHIGDVNKAWCLNFDLGHSLVALHSYTRVVRLVKSGEENEQEN